MIHTSQLQVQYFWVAVIASAMQPYHSKKFEISTLIPRPQLYICQCQNQALEVKLTTRRCWDSRPWSGFCSTEIVIWDSRLLVAISIIAMIRQEQDGVWNAWLEVCESIAFNHHIALQYLGRPKALLSSRPRLWWRIWVSGEEWRFHLVRSSPLGAWFLA